MQITNKTTKETQGTLVTDVTVTFKTDETVERRDAILESLSTLQKNAQTVKGRNIFKNLYHLYTFLSYNANQMYDSTMISYDDEENFEMAKEIKEAPFHATFDFRNLDSSNQNKTEPIFMHLKNNFAEAPYVDMTTSLIINRDVAKLLYTMKLNVEQIRLWTDVSLSEKDSIAEFHLSDHIDGHDVYMALTKLEEFMKFFNNLVNTVITEMYLPKV